MSYSWKSDLSCRPLLSVGQPQNDQHIHPPARQLYPMAAAAAAATWCAVQSTLATHSTFAFCTDAISGLKGSAETYGRASVSSRHVRNRSTSNMRCSITPPAEHVPVTVQAPPAPHVATGVPLNPRAQLPLQVRPKGVVGQLHTAFEGTVGAAVHVTAAGRTGLGSSLFNRQ